MITFADGTAMNSLLQLKRMPIFLRVVRDTVTDKIDALDQLEDEAKPTEYLTAYLLDQKTAGHYHVHRKGGGGFYPSGTYHRIEHQPSQETMRDNDAWTLWVEKQAEILKLKP